MKGFLFVGWGIGVGTTAKILQMQDELRKEMRRWCDGYIHEKIGKVRQRAKALKARINSTPARSAMLVIKERLLRNRLSSRIYAGDGAPGYCDIVMGELIS